MSIVDHEGCVEYPFSKKTVFDAIMEASSNIDGLTLDSANEISGRLVFKAGVSLASWGENVSVQLMEVAFTRTKMVVISSPKTGAMFGGAMDMGKNRRNIEKIIGAVSGVLANKPAESEKTSNGAIVSTADELLKLKSLLDSGVLTQDEFDKQKKQILSNDTLAESSSKLDHQSKEIQKVAPVCIESENKDYAVQYILIAIFVIAIIVAMVVVL